jgi:alkylhydroperoxidase/carboxymuconolactone decarboxylase family protein YurZ
MSAKKAKGDDDIMQRIKRERGFIPAEWAYLAGKDPEFWDAYNALYEKTLTDGKALSAKIKEFITMGVLAYREFDVGVCKHAERAQRLGATKQELIEAVETVTVSGGSPALRAGIAGLILLEEKEKSQAAKNKSRR